METLIIEFWNYFLRSLPENFPTLFFSVILLFASGLSNHLFGSVRPILFLLGLKMFAEVLTLWVHISLCTCQLALILRSKSEEGYQI
jgi:hypothetical protein